MFHREMPGSADPGRSGDYWPEDGGYGGRRRPLCDRKILSVHEKPSETLFDPAAKEPDEMSSIPVVSMKDRAAWRSWLAKNHDTRAEVWLVYPKKASGIPSVSYEEAVEEAICFGWIDGQVRTIDRERYRQRFSPRTKKSRWSALNISRAKRMVAEGLMTDTGRAAFEEAMQQERTVPSRESYAIPAELETALGSNPAAAGNFRNMAATHRLMYAAWVGSAKKPETRQKRAERSIGFLLEKKRLIDIFGIRKKE